MRELLIHFLLWFNWVVIVYAIAVAFTQLLLVASASTQIMHTLRRDVESRMDDVFAHPAAPGVSILVPAFNEEATIVESVRAVLGLKYPDFELIVVDDGSTDKTFAALREAFDLIETPRVVPLEVPIKGRVLSVHSQRGGGNLLVIRKENAGRAADALNVALNAARTPLICMVDADSVIEPNALLHVVRPFVEDPNRVVAAGGVIRPSNGVKFRRGTIDVVHAPRRLLAQVQVVEYLRAFLIGRVGWTWLNGLLIISGAFGIFRRADVVELGGMHADSLGQDAELVAGLHRMLRRKKQEYRMLIVPQPVCWTEVPETMKDLRQQRRRWSHGLLQVLWHQRGAFLRPRQGRFGFFILPYYLFFELLGPVVEVLGVPAILGAWHLGLLNGWYALLIFGLSVGFGMMLSVSAVLLDEVTFHRYERWRDLGLLLLATLIESAGLRWLHSWWRFRGLLDSINPRRPGWGSLNRIGFHKAAGTPA